jgi:hypothetical protein
MADFGFESNDDYEFQVRALLGARVEHLRCLQITGESGRRKTAFANALARALDYPHVIYHDFSVPEPPPQPVFVSVEDQENPEPAEPPLSRFERAIVETCAYSEAARAVLILDQLQAAPFQEQLRLQQFIVQHEWPLTQGVIKAHAPNLLVMMISEAPLYHSLARVSYRVWTDAGGGPFEFRPEDVGLGQDARPLFECLARLFEALGSTPTPSEFQRIVADLMHQVRTEDQLRHCLYGWMERVDRPRLFATALQEPLRTAVVELNALLGLEEVVMGGEDSPPA